MIRVLAALLLSAPPCLAARRDFPSLLRVSSGFHFPSKTPGTSRELENALGAVVELDSGGSSRCAGVYISKTGYVLTAAHCLKDHLTQASRLAAADLSVLEHPWPIARYDKIVPELELEGESVVLAVAGKGVLAHFYSPPDVGRLSGDDVLLDRLGAAAAGDWAILRTRRDSPAPCVAARPSPLADGEALWLAGYPGPASRPGGLGSTGSGGLMTTVGEKDSDMSSSEWLQTVDPRSQDVFRRIYQPRVSAGDLILASMDSRKGMSGGPLLDREGKLAGVFTASGNTQNRFFDRSSIGIGIQHVILELADQGIDPSQFFKCE